MEAPGHVAWTHSRRGEAKGPPSGPHRGSVRRAVTGHAYALCGAVEIRIGRGCTAAAAAPAEVSIAGWSRGLHHAAYMFTNTLDFREEGDECAAGSTNRCLESTNRKCGKAGKAGVEEYM